MRRPLSLLIVQVCPVNSFMIKAEEETGMVDIELTQVRIEATINNPFRVMALFVAIVLAAIIVIHAS